jgi:hypothetical protein
MKLGSSGQSKVEYALAIALAAIATLGTLLLALALGFDSSGYPRAPFGG